MTRTNKKAKASNKSAARAAAAEPTFEAYRCEQFEKTKQVVEKLPPPNFGSDRPLLPDEQNAVTQFHDALNSSFNDMTGEEKLSWVNKVLDVTGLNDQKRRAIQDYYVPNSPYSIRRIIQL
jgi:predicted ATPase